MRCLFAGDDQWRELDDVHGHADCDEAERQRDSDRLESYLVDLLLSENLIVLFGLGPSLSVMEDGRRVLPDMSDLWKAAEAKAEPKFKKILDAVHYSPAAGSENIEALLSHCQMAHRLLPNADVLNFITDTESLIVSKCTFDVARADLSSHETFLRKVARRSTRLPRTKVFTTNYDLCLEHAATQTGFTVLDGFSFGARRRFDGTLFSHDIVLREQEKPLDFVSGVFHLYKLHGSIDWDRVGDAVLRSDSPRSPVLIYPRESKFQSSYEQPFLELMARFQFALRQPNTGLLVCGFGFNDQHITMPILSAVRTNVGLKALVVDPILEDDTAIEAKAALKEMRTLIEAGDARLALLGATFESLVSRIPDLATADEEQRQLERIRDLLAKR